MINLKREEECWLIINRVSKMCGQEIKVYPFLNLNFIRKSIEPLKLRERIRDLKDRDKRNEVIGAEDGSLLGNVLS